MASSDISPQHARLLAGLLRERQRAGLTTRQLAAVAGERSLGHVRWSQAKVSRIEGGQRKPTIPEVTAWLDATASDASIRAELLQYAESIAVEAKAWSHVWRDAGGAAGRQASYARWEAASTRLVVFQPVCVPGLLQTAEYARHVLAAAGVDDSAVPDAIAARLDRARVLYDPARSVTVLITEAALRLRIAPVAVLVEQLDRVSSIATLRNVDVGVVPLDAPVTVTPLSGFQLFEMPDEAIVTAELVADEVVITESERVERYREVIEKWRQAAVFGTAATAHLARIRATLLEG